MHAPRCALVSLLISLSSLFSCSSEKASGPQGDGEPCSTADDCTRATCVCADKTTTLPGASCVSGSGCFAPADYCGDQCSGKGGVTTTTVLEGVGSSAECQSFCDAQVKACPSVPCKKGVACEVQKGECAASTRARLDCWAKKAKFDCSGGALNIARPDCGDLRPLCSGATDAGKD